jgi:hypothetical protein
MDVLEKSRRDTCLKIVLVACESFLIIWVAWQSFAVTLFEPAFATYVSCNAPFKTYIQVAPPMSSSPAVLKVPRYILNTSGTLGRCGSSVPHPSAFSRLLGLLAQPCAFTRHGPNLSVVLVSYASLPSVFINKPDDSR